MSRKRIIAESGVILAVAVLLSVAANSVRDRSHRLAWLKGEARARVSAPAASPASGQDALYVEVSAAAADRLHESGALFLDARRTAAYEAGHIAGARSIPVWENDADARVESLRGEGIRYDWDIVIYCSGPTCEDSSKLAEKLALAGYFKLHVYKNGFPEWENNGRPVRQGAAP
jgi:rhodanese-related sulfurtransferase